MCLSVRVERKEFICILTSGRWSIHPRNINGTSNPPNRLDRLPLIFSHLFLLFLFLFCRDCRVVRDPQTLKSKGYGFVSFLKKSVSDLSLYCFCSISCLFLALNWSWQSESLFGLKLDGGRGSEY